MGESEEEVDLRPEDVEGFLPEGEALVLRDPGDGHEVAVVMDAHDVAQIVEEMQGTAIRKWLYELPGEGGGGPRIELSYKGVQDIVQRMNFTGRVKIGLLPETLQVEQVTQDAGNGPEPFWRARVFARDEVTGQVMPGVSTEPQRLRLKKATADRKRRDGQKIPEDNTIFDVFSETKAVNKATRNALRTFIPEELAQTVIAMFAGDPSRVERIRTEAEQRVAEQAPALVDERAQQQVARARELYSQIRELHGGRGKVKMPPGVFNAWVNASQHSHERLDDMLAALQERLETWPEVLAEEALQEQAVDSAREVECPSCGARPRQFCQGVRGSHRERVAARLEQLRAAR